MINYPYPETIWRVFSMGDNQREYHEGSYATALGVWTHPLDPNLAYFVEFNGKRFSYGEFLCMFRSMRTITRKHAKYHPGST